MKFIQLFLVSSIIEFIVFYLYLYKFKKSRGDLLEFISIVIALNLFTQTIFIFILPLIKMNFIYYLVVSEFFIFIIEGLLLARTQKGLSYLSAIFVSFLANISSWQFTPFIMYILI